MSAVNMLLGSLLIIVGVVVLLRYVVVRRGRRPGSREWVHHGEFGIGNNMLILPAAGLIMITLGAVRLDDDSPFTFTVALIFGPVAMALIGLHFFLPRAPVWLLPGWARGSVRGRRAAEKRARRRAAAEKRAHRAAEKERTRR